MHIDIERKVLKCRKKLKSHKLGGSNLVQNEIIPGTFPFINIAHHLPHMTSHHFICCQENASSLNTIISMRHRIEILSTSKKNSHFQTALQSCRSLIHCHTGSIPTKQKQPTKDSPVSEVGEEHFL